MIATYEEDTEISDGAEAHWSTSTILTMFFAASLISALFVGLGFSYNRTDVPQPAAGGPATARATPPRIAAGPVQSSSTVERVVQRPDPRAFLSDAKKKAELRTISATRNIQGPAIPATPARSRMAPSTEVRNSAAGATASRNRYMVQVGAIGNRRDARRLVSQLRKQGFHAAIYPGARDKYLHVQLGPFTTTEQAQTVRHRVMAHGYHAMLKTAG